MSATATTLIAAIAGLLGATIGALLTGRQQRSAQLRDRMLDVTLEYVEALYEAVPYLLKEPTDEVVECKEALARAKRLSHRAVLLFGPDSPAGEQIIDAYYNVLTCVNRATSPLDIDPRFEESAAVALSLWQDDFQRIEAQAERSIDRCAALAGRAIRSGGRHPWMDRGRRVRRALLRTPKQRRILRQLRKLAEARDELTEQLRSAHTDMRKAHDRAESESRIEHV